MGRREVIENLADIILSDISANHSATTFIFPQKYFEDYATEILLGDLIGCIEKKCKGITAIGNEVYFQYTKGNNE